MARLGLSTQKDVSILNAKASTGVDLVSGVNVSDFRNAVISFATASSANLTVKVQGAIGTVPPTWTSAQSASNMWDYVQIIDLEDGNPIDGDTGVSCAGTDDFRLFEVNVNALDWINVIVTARSAGNVTVKATLTDNA